MRRIIITLLLLFLTIPALASDQSCIVGKKKSATCADASCTGFLACQNFETTSGVTSCTTTASEDNSETLTCSAGTGATINMDYGTGPLRGSQSLYFTNGTGTSTVYLPFSAQTEVYGFVEFYLGSDGGTATVVSLRSNATAIFSVSYNKTNHKLAVGATLGSATIAANTKYFMWYYYKAGSGADALVKVWVSTTKTMPATPDIDISNGAYTSSVNRLYLENTASTQNIWFDRVLVKTTSIGDVCD